MREAIKALGIIVLFSLSGCFEDAGQSAAAELRKGLENSSNNIKEGMASVAKVDPVGLRTVLEKNESLQEYVKRLQQEIEEQRNRSGYVKVDGSSELLFRFSGMRGRFWVEAWLDSRDTNKWIERELLFANEANDVDGIFALNKMPPLCANSSLCLDGPALQAIARADYMKKQLRNYLDQPYATQREGVGRTYPLDLRLGSGGVHEVHLALTPVSDNDKKPWYVSYEVILRVRGKNDAATERVVTVGRLDSSDPKLAGNWAYGKELSKKVATFVVALPKERSE